MDIGLCYNLCVEFNPKLFADFIQKKFAFWRGAGRESLADYAAHIHVSQQVASNWYRGKLKERPKPETFARLIELYGDDFDVYDALGLPRPSGGVLDLFPPEIKAELYSIGLEISAELTANRIQKGTPEAEEVSREVLARHDISLKSNSAR